MQLDIGLIPINRLLYNITFLFYAKTDLYFSLDFINKKGETKQCLLKYMVRIMSL